MLLIWGPGSARSKPSLSLLPSVAVIGLFLIYPALRTIQYSFADATSSKYVGFKNYTALLKQHDFQITLVNTLLWIAIAPAFVVALGLGVAVLADRLRARGEKTAKSIIFLPM